jgi:hypothetical protein
MMVIRFGISQTSTPAITSATPALIKPEINPAPR